jgi:hypothetical protein
MVRVHTVLPEDRPTLEAKFVWISDESKKERGRNDNQINKLTRGNKEGRKEGRNWQKSKLKKIKINSRIYRTRNVFPFFFQLSCDLRNQQKNCAKAFFFLQKKRCFRIATIIIKIIEKYRRKEFDDWNKKRNCLLIKEMEYELYFKHFEINFSGV